MQMKNLRRNQGFTLMEMLIVIIIIFILATVSFGGYKFIKEMTARKKAEVQIGMLQDAIQAYYKAYGEYPEHDQESGQGGTPTLFDALFPSDTSEDPFCEALNPEQDKQGWLLGNTGTSLTIYDPWGVPYFYRTNGANPDFDLWSAGPDGRTEPGAGGAYDPDHPDNLDDIRVGW